MQMRMTFLLHSNISTVTQTISTETITQANFDLINHITRFPYKVKVCLSGVEY